MKKIKLHWQILIALVIAIFYGVVFTEYVGYISWMGDLFLRALKMIIVPLIFTSIVTGVANIGNAENLGRLGLKTFGYYLLTTTFAILTGLIFVNILQPGVGADLGFSQEVEGLATAKESFGDTILNIIPTNIFGAFAGGKILGIIFNIVSPNDSFAVARPSTSCENPRSAPTPGCNIFTNIKPVKIAKVVVSK